MASTEFLQRTWSAARHDADRYRCNYEALFVLYPSLALESSFNNRAAVVATRLHAAREAPPPDAVFLRDYRAASVTCRR